MIEELKVDQPSKTKRVDYLDILKCLGMFIVVSGHIHPYYGWFSLTIHSFCIPLYFWLSGLTFKRSKYGSVWQLIKKRAKTLLLPYLMFSLVTWVFWALYNYALHNPVDYWSPLLQTFIAQGSGGYLVHNVPLWFIPCLFLVEVLYYFIDKLPEWANILVCVLCAVIGNYMVRGGHIDTFTLLPWNFESAMSAILFYCCGNVMMKHVSFTEIQDKVLKHKPVSIVLMLALTAVLVFTAPFNEHITLGSNSLGRSTILFYLNAFMGIIAVTILSILMCSVKNASKAYTAVMDYFKWFGKNSFYVMATHIPVKGILMIGMSYIIHHSVSYIAHSIAWTIVAFVLTCAVCSLLSLWIGKWKKMDEQRVERWKLAKSIAER